MKITLKNNELATAINFLESLELPTKDSRHRTKLVKLLKQAFNELSEEELSLMGKFDLLDEAGLLKEEAKREPAKVKEFNKEQKELMKEEVTIEGGMFAKNIDEMPRILAEYNGTLSGGNAEIYDRLLDEFEKKRR